jgi:hypothetical protein
MRAGDVEQPNRIANQDSVSSDFLAHYPAVSFQAQRSMSEQCLTTRVAGLIFFE